MKVDDIVIMGVRNIKMIITKHRICTNFRGRCMEKGTCPGYLVETIDVRGHMYTLCPLRRVT